MNVHKAEQELKGTVMGHYENEMRRERKLNETFREHRDHEMFQMIHEDEYEWFLNETVGSGNVHLPEPCEIETCEIERAVRRMLIS